MMSFSFFSLIEIYSIMCTDILWLELNSAKPNEIESNENVNGQYKSTVRAFLQGSFSLFLSATRFLSLSISVWHVSFLWMKNVVALESLRLVCQPCSLFLYHATCLPLCTCVHMCDCCSNGTARAFYLLLALFCRIDPLSQQQLSYISSASPFTHLNCMHILFTFMA